MRYLSSVLPVLPHRSFWAYLHCNPIQLSGCWCYPQLLESYHFCVHSTITSSKLTSGGVAVPASFCMTADFVPDKFPSKEPTKPSLMVSTDHFAASVIFFVLGDSNDVASTCFSAPVPVVVDDVAD